MRAVAVEVTGWGCEQHREADAGAVPALLWIGGRLYQFGACTRCAARLAEEKGPFVTRLPDQAPPRPQGQDSPAARSPWPKRDLVTAVLRKRIADGTYPAGTYLPRQQHLAGEHGMSATPVRQACDDLEIEGLIRSLGQGRYLVEPAAGAAR